MLAAHADSENALLLFKGGVAGLRNDTDHEPLFRQESNFAYLFGVFEPDCLGVIEMPTGRATLFVPKLPPEYATWMGAIHPPEHFTAKHGVDATPEPRRKEQVGAGLRRADRMPQNISKHSTR